MNHESAAPRAKKSLGQNFLQDANVCRRIVDSINLTSNDNIVEIGPGLGALSSHIEDSSPKSYTALEMDEVLANRLEESYPSIKIIRGDALKFDWDSLNEVVPCKIIGNLPYNVGSKLIWEIVSRVRAFERAVFMVQHEVGIRLTASPGTKAYGGLTVWVKNFCDTRYLFKVPPSVFKPRPKVDSAVIAFTPLQCSMDNDAAENLSKLIKMLFQQRRKQISTILKKEWSEAVEEWFDSEGVDTRSRPENLSPQQFLSLSKVV